MKHPLSFRVLIIPVVSAAAAIALVALALMPAPDVPDTATDPAAIDGEVGKQLPLNTAAPVPAPRP